MTRVLVTGGNGFIGSHLVEALLKTNHHITVLDLYPPDTPHHGTVKQVYGDVRDRETVQYALEGVSAVYHLAAAHHDHGISRQTYDDVNEQATVQLLALMEQVNVNRITFTSSVAVYGEDGTHSENETPAPTTPYGASKYAAEVAVSKWQTRSAERTAVIVRPTAVIGTGHYANLFRLASSIDRNVYVQVGRGANRKSLASVRNLVDSLVIANQATSGDLTVYNFVDTPNLTSREIAELLRRALGKRLPPLQVPELIAIVGAGILSTLKSPWAVSPAAVRKFTRAETVFPATVSQRFRSEKQYTIPDEIQAFSNWYLSLDDRTPKERLPSARLTGD